MPLQEDYILDSVEFLIMLLERNIVEWNKYFWFFGYLNGVWIIVIRWTPFNLLIHFMKSFKLALYTDRYLLNV